MILEPVFHVFHNKVDSKTECILRNLGDDTQVTGVLDWLDGTANIARDLNCLEKWTYCNFVKFNKGR